MLIKYGVGTCFGGEVVIVIEKTDCCNFITVDDALEKTFMIESINFNEQTKETGAAFCIAPNTFLTCAHVVKTYNKNTER